MNFFAVSAIWSILVTATVFLTATLGFYGSVDYVQHGGLLSFYGTLMGASFASGVLFFCLLGVCVKIRQAFGN